MEYVIVSKSYLTPTETANIKREAERDQQEIEKNNEENQLGNIDTNANEEETIAENGHLLNGEIIEDTYLSNLYFLQQTDFI